MRTAVISLTTLLLASCSSVDQTPQTQTDEGPVSIITGETGGWSLSEFMTQSAAQSTALPVNAILWRAALDIAALLPISDVDTFAGTIVTDWHSLPTNQNERIKITVFVLDRELRSDAIKAVVYIQKRPQKDAPWGNTQRDQTFARKIEDLILTRAREIRAEAINDVQQ